MLSVVVKSNKKTLVDSELIKLEKSKANPSKYIVQAFSKSVSQELDKFIGSTSVLKILMKDKFNRTVILHQGNALLHSSTNTSDFTDIECSISFSDNYYPYRPDLLNHITKYWGRDLLNPIDRSQFSGEDFCLYLDTTLLWSGVPELLEIKSRYVLDGASIQSKCDLFIHLGEIFIGDKGYFGLNLDALEECFSLTIKGVDSKIPFELKDGEILSEKIGQSYFDSLTDVLNRFFLVEST